MPVKTKNEMRKYNREYYAKKVADRPDCFVCGKKFSPVKYTDKNGEELIYDYDDHESPRVLCLYYSSDC